MRTVITIILFDAGWLLQMLGGPVFFGLFFYGIYILFADSVVAGLLLIGASVVVGWIHHFVGGLLMLAGSRAAAAIGAKNSEEN